VILQEPALAVVVVIEAPRHERLAGAFVDERLLVPGDAHEVQSRLAGGRQDEGDQRGKHVPLSEESEPERQRRGADNALRWRSGSDRRTQLASSSALSGSSTTLSPTRLTR